MKLFATLFSVLLFLFVCFPVSAQKSADTLHFSLYFDFGKYELRPESERLLLELGEKMKHEPLYRIYLQGSTDDKGSEEWNLTLSHNRCISVENFLIAHGTPTAFFKHVEAWGERNPIVNNASDENRQHNRRVDVFVLYHLVEEAAKPELTVEVKEVPLKIAVVEKEAVTKYVTSKIVEEDTLSLSNYLRSLVSKNQVFHFDNRIGNDIKTASGIWLHFPADAFEIGGGNSVVSLTIQEFVNKRDIVLAGLYTQTDGNDLLESGGMLNMSAKVGGTKVGLKANKKVKVRFPKGKKSKKGMKLFFSNNWGGNWELGVPNEYKDSMSMETIHFNHYFTRWGLPGKATAEVKDLYDTYCEVCEHGIAYDKEESRKKEVRFLGIKLFSYKKWINRKAKYAKSKRFVEGEQERRSEEMNEYESENCAQMKAELMKGIEGSIGFEDWYLNIYPHLRKYYRKMVSKGDYYVFKGIKLGWTNCDRYLGMPSEELITLNWEEETNPNKIIRVSLKEDEVTVPNDAAIPKNKPIYIIGIKRENKKIYLSIIETMSDEEIKVMEWREVNSYELVRELNLLNTNS